MEKNYLKIIENFDKYKGKHFSEGYYTTVVAKSSDGYYTEDGKKKVLFKFRKKVISKDLLDLAEKSFLALAKKKHPNRGIAGGILPGQKTARKITSTGQNEGNYVCSNIAGYYDRALREHRGMFDSQVVCRTTSFTLSEHDKWMKSLPFIRRCSECYKELGGNYYKSQKKEWLGIHKSLRIPGTVFTTITTNYNWRTACHTDTGDYSSGLGNLILTGRNYTGGYLGFPQFKLLIKIEPGDFLLMDVHQYHCNTPIKTGPDGFRLSFVMYLREDMKSCSRRKVINGTEYLH